MDFPKQSIFSTLVVRQAREIVKNFKTIMFEDGHGISYLAGQYLTLVDRPREKDEIRRSYSITSCPELNEPLSIGVKRIENGHFSRLLVDHAKPGDLLTTTGVAGFFTLPARAAGLKQLVFFAAGSGITPVISLLKSAILSHPQARLVLIYSSPAPERAAYREELLALQEKNAGRFFIEFLFSNSTDLSKARLNPELLWTLCEKYSAHLLATLFYVCGPEAYMRMCTFVLQSQGFSPSAIRRENFVITRVRPPAHVPPDKDTHIVSLVVGGTRTSFPVHYPDTILNAAKKHGISLPYSCETGKCGSCAASCLKGRVWMSYNEVLTEKELAAGLVLTCVGHPLGGDVTLSF